MADVGAINIAAPADATAVTLTLFAPDSSTVYALALTKANGVWSGTHTLSPTPADSSDPYTFTIVATTPRGAIPISSGDYGYIAGGVWYDSPDLGTDYEGRYTTETALRLFMGTTNATAYGDGDGDGNADSGAIQQVIDAAEAEVDSILAGGPYAVPLVFTGGTVDPILRMHVNGLAAYYLNAKRPLTGQQAPGVNYDALRKRALRALNSYRMGLRTIAGAGAGATPVPPQSIAPPRDVDGRLLPTSANPQIGWRYGYGYGYGWGW